MKNKEPVPDMADELDIEEEQFCDDNDSIDSNSSTASETLPETVPEIITMSFHPNPSSVWNVIGASVQGTSHIRRGVHCQDAHDYRWVNEELVVLAVADGLGSASLSQEGAQRATQTATEAIEEFIQQKSAATESTWEEAVKYGFQKARSDLEEWSEINRLPLQVYGTTLILVCVNAECLSIGHIGDGAVVALFADGTLSTVSVPQNGEYVNQTFALTQDDALESVQLNVSSSEVYALAIFSDGIQNLSINHQSSQPFSNFFIPLFKQLSTIEDCRIVSQSLGDFLASDRVCAKTDDDKTLVLIGRKDIEMPEISI